MSSNILVFPGEHLEQAAYAALDPAADLVIVRNNYTDLSDRNFLRHRAEVVQRFDALTPIVERQWQQRDYLLNKPDQLQLQEVGINNYGQLLHIDLVDFVGFIASTNLGDVPRFVHASRQGVPTFADANSIDEIARERYQRSLQNKPIADDDWVVIRPGDSALWGALPHLAEHATDGDTRQVVLTYWRAMQLNRYSPTQARD